MFIDRYSTRPLSLARRILVIDLAHLSVIKIDKTGLCEIQN